MPDIGDDDFIQQVDHLLKMAARQGLNDEHNVGGFEVQLRHGCFFRLQDVADRFGVEGNVVHSGIESCTALVVMQLLVAVGQEGDHHRFLDFGGIGFGIFWCHDFHGLGLRHRGSEYEEGDE